jgi:hypothetical protein
LSGKITPRGQPICAHRREKRKHLASGKSPIAANRLSAYFHVIKAKQKKKALTFGGFIAATYRACGKRRARGIVQLAVNAHLIEFRGQQRFVII